MSFAYVADAKRGSHDPTGTTKLRAAFRAAGKMQLRQLRAQLRTCIVDHDLLGLAGTNISVMASAPDVKLAAFNHWLSSAAHKYLHRDWAQPYVERAWQAGLAAGARDAKTMPHPHSGQLLAQLLRQELDGIIAAIVQQVGRQAARRYSSPHKACRQLSECLDKVGATRIVALTNTMTIAAFNRAKVAVYRQAGFTQVGVIPETVRRDAMADAYIAEPIEVGVRTAGDDRVCDECDDYAEGAPYDIDEVEDSLPLHPNCRCTWFPWDDRRFEHDSALEMAPHAVILPVGWVIAEPGQNAPATDYAALGTYSRWPFNDVYNEEDHPRDIHGQWIYVGGPVALAEMTKVGGQLGSNKGGQYQHGHNKYYVKQLDTPAHARNEYIAADLYALAGARTLAYHPVKDDPHAVATEWQGLKKSNAKDFTPEERTKAQHDFAVHAWLANWDAVGLEHDNLGIDHEGRVVTLDVGGALEYRAQGEPKGAAFGSHVTEWTSLRSTAQNPQAASIFGSMTAQQLAASAAVVGKIKPKDIRTVVMARGGSEALVEKLLDRRQDIISFGLNQQVAAAGLAAAGVPAATVPTTKGSKPESVKGWVASKNHGQAVQRIQKKIDNPAGPSQGYRWTVTKHLEEAEYYNLPEATVTKLKAKIAESLANQAKAQAAKGNTAKAEILQQQAVEIAHANDTPAPKPLPPAPVSALEPDLAFVAKIIAKQQESAPTVAPPAAPAPAHDPLPPPEQLTKEQKIALKTTPLPFYGAATQAAQKAVQSFNTQYAGKVLTTGSELQQKIGAYQGLKAFLAKEEQVATATQQAELAKSAAKQAEQQVAQQVQWSKQYGNGDPKAQIHIDTLIKLVKGSGSYGDAGIWLKNAAGDIAKGKVSGIAPSQLALIKCYTGHFYGKVNGELRHGTMTEEQHRFAHGLNEALEAMPTQHAGVTYRGVNDLSKEEAARYIPGHVVLERAFMSTSKHTRSGDYKFIVTGHSGRDVQMVSEHPSEEEVLFKYNTAFRVTAREGNTIHLQEVDY